MNTIEVLMIDDIEANYSSLKNEAASFNILLKYKQYLDQGIKEVSDNRNIAAVILDGKGFLSSNQIKGTETEAHVHEGLTQLKILEEKQDRFIPKFILTAWYEILKDSVGDRAPLYNKNRISEVGYKTEFFSDIRAQVEKTSDFHIKNKYKEVFEAVKDYLPRDNDLRLHKILMKTDVRECDEEDFNLVRNMLESIFKKASAIDSEFLPRQLFHRDGRPNYEDCIDYLCGREIKNRKTGDIMFRKDNNPIAPPLIQYTITYIKSVTSGLSHDYTFIWTKYAYASVVHALCEIILWFKGYVEANYERS